jgi:signal transduction histidine kinase/ActR/RegA family two-component response regulator/HPt (histidine-containing phosphotransfer) domain-containing protein
MHPNRHLPLLLLLLCWLPALATAAPDGVELTSAERDWLAANPHITLGSDAEWRPFVWQTGDGSQAGIETDLIARINALTGADIQLVLGDWGDMVERAERGELYGLAASASHAERAERFLFSASPYSTHKFIFTRQDSAIASMDDLAGRRVGVLRRNLSDLKLLDAWPAIVQVELDSPLALAVALQNATLDAVISSTNLHWIATENLLPDVRLAFPVPGSRIDLRYSVGKEHAPLVAILDKAIAAIAPEEILQILERWGERKPPAVDLTGEERAWLSANPTVRVGAYPLPPYMQGQDGRAAGYLVELFQAVAARAGLGTEFRFEPLERVIDDIAGGGLDATLAVNASPERQALMHLSARTSRFVLEVFARKEARDIAGVESLAGKTLASYLGYSWNAHYPEYLPRTRVLIAADVEGMLQMVADGRADAAIFEGESGRALLRRYRLTGVEPKGVAVLGGRRSHEGHFWGVSRRLPLLASILDKAYAQMPEAEQQRIWNRWFARETGAGEVDLNAAERAYLDAASFRRAFATAWMPFDFAAADGTPTGVAEDYWTLLRDKLGLVEATTARRPFGDILAAMQRGDIDLYAATTRTADREAYAVFSDPYERFPLAIAGPAGAGLFAGTDALTGRRVAVGRDYSAYHLLQAHSPDIDFVLVDDTRAALEAVAAGRAEVAVDILPVLHQQIEGFPADRVKLVGVTDVQFPLEIMVRREHAALIPLLNRAIAAITPEERAAIHNQWLLRDVVTAPDYTWLWQVLMTALLLLATILVWNHRLHREVWRRKQAETELLRAKAIADNANRAKGDFLANMSHEIRTPLNAVIGLTHLSLETNPAPTLREYLGKIDLSARTLLALINDILDLSRIEAGKLQPRQAPLALAEVLERVRVMLEQPAAEKGLALHIEGPAEPVGRLLGDELRLTQVLLNLVDNAVKFTARGRVTLAVRVEDESARALQLRFTVTDTGIGIPEERRADLFDAFTQIDTSSSRGHGGSGLGLAISARLVALMGGRLEVESVAGSGSAFWFSLAFPHALEQAAAAAPLPAPAALRGVRVLVAEDDPVSRLLARELLDRRGALVTLATTGTEAVAAAARDDFDIVLMDIRMPDMDGLTACRHIRALPHGRLPIIAVTANALAGERERCLAAGMDGYLTKPLEAETLDAELGRWLPSTAEASGEARPAAATAGVPLALPGFDAANVQHWMDQAPEAWLGMARAFIAEHPATAAAIGAALDAGDRARAAGLLHRLRGAAAALGADQLTAEAGRLELALAGDGPVDAGLRERFCTSAEHALAVLTAVATSGVDAAATQDNAEPPCGDTSAHLRELHALDHQP